MNPIIPIDATLISDSLAYVGQLVTDLKLVLGLIIGLPIGFWLIGQVVSLVGRLRGRGKKA